jgi:integral membrane protein
VPAESVTPATAAGTPAADLSAVPPKIRGALQRYRISALVVGWGLIVLCITMIFKYVFGGPDNHFDWMVATWGPIHGVLYVIYVLLTFDLAYKSRWSLLGIIKVIVAGVIPGVSFVAERWVYRTTLARKRI